MKKKVTKDRINTVYDAGILVLVTFIQAPKLKFISQIIFSIDASAPLRVFGGAKHSFSSSSASYMARRKTSKITNGGLPCRMIAPSSASVSVPLLRNLGPSSGKSTKGFPLRTALQAYGYTITYVKNLSTRSSSPNQVRACAAILIHAAVIFPHIDRASHQRL